MSLVWHVLAQQFCSLCGNRSLLTDLNTLSLHGLSEHGSKGNMHRNSHRKCFVKKVLLKISQYSQENKFRSATLLKRDFNKGAPVNIAKSLRTPILKNLCERLLLYVPSTYQWFSQSCYKPKCHNSTFSSLTIIIRNGNTIYCNRLSLTFTVFMKVCSLMNF